MCANWKEAVTDFPELGQKDVIEITYYLMYEEQNDTKEVERVERNPDGSWVKKIHFLDSSLLRKSQSGNWGFKSISETVRPLRFIEVVEDNS